MAGSRISSTGEGQCDQLPLVRISVAVYIAVLVLLKTSLVSNRQRPLCFPSEPTLSRQQGPTASRLRCRAGMQSNLVEAKALPLGRL